MTEEKLKRAWELHDKIESKKYYLEAIQSLAHNPRPISQSMDVNINCGYAIKITIPADIVGREFARQAEELGREIEELEEEFNAL